MVNYEELFGVHCSSKVRSRLNFRPTAAAQEQAEASHKSVVVLQFVPRGHDTEQVPEGFDNPPKKRECNSHRFSECNC